MFTAGSLRNHILTTFMKRYDVLQLLPICANCFLRSLQKRIRDPWWPTMFCFLKELRLYFQTKHDIVLKRFIYSQFSIHGNYLKVNIRWTLTFYMKKTFTECTSHLGVFWIDWAIISALPTHSENFLYQFLYLYFSKMSHIIL